MAEILVALIEQTGGQTVDWQPNGISIPAMKFQGAFTPIRYRKAAVPDDMPDRIVPRRVRPGMSSFQPMTADTLIRSIPKDVPLGLQDCPEALNAVFRDPETCEIDEDKPTSARLAAWTVTASVGVMNPAIGIPLVAYNALKGEDFRLSAHALTLTAAFFGFGSSTVGYLPFF